MYEKKCYRNADFSSSIKVFRNGNISSIFSYFSSEFARFSAGGCGGTAHRTRMFAAWNVLAALSVKSTAKFGFGVVNVTTTGLNVPTVNDGILTTALTGVPTTVSDCKPVPALT